MRWWAGLAALTAVIPVVALTVVGTAVAANANVQLAA
jgi:hypothetical protein